MPKIARIAKELLVFQRTPCFVAEKNVKTYPEWVKVRRRKSSAWQWGMACTFPPAFQRLFAWLPPALLLERWFQFWRMELLFYTLFDTRRREMSRSRRKLLEEEMASRMVRAGVPEPDRLVPKNEELGCKRITLSSEYLEVQKVNKKHFLGKKVKFYLKL